MATGTYAPIASITLGSSASSVEFSSIPQDYRDLVLVQNGTSGSNGTLLIELNSDGTSSNYSYVLAYGDGSNDGSDSASNQTIGRVETALGSNILQLMDYSATNKHTSILARTNLTTQTWMTAARWANTSAVTAVKLTHGGDFDTGSTFSLFGIEA